MSVAQTMFNHMVEYKQRTTQRGTAPQNLDRVFQALSDPSRRQIVELLREAGRLKVGDIAQAFDVSLNAVSKHLKVLEGAGLVRREILGREHWIEVRWAGLQPAYEWLHFYHHFWSSRLDSLVDYVREKDKGDDR